MEQLKSRIEAVLFVTAKVLQVKDIAEILEEEPEVVEEALLELIMDYASRDGALEIDDENGYILQVKQEHLDIVEKLCPVELKPPVLKTLTVIALKEPIRQSLLKDLRGSNAYEHVQELLEKGLISRHKDKNGRSFNIKTTPKFAEYFKLKGDVRALVKTLNIDKGVKDDIEDMRQAAPHGEKGVKDNVEDLDLQFGKNVEKGVKDDVEDLTLTPTLSPGEGADKTTPTIPAVGGANKTTPTLHAGEGISTASRVKAFRREDGE